MSDLGDFLIGFTQPLRDLIFSLYIYLFITAGKTITSTLSPSSGHAFNIWSFSVLFVMISIVDNIGGIISDINDAYRNPIDAFIRFFGIVMGIMAWGFIMVVIYANIGGDIGDAFVSAAISGFCLLLGFFIRAMRM